MLRVKLARHQPHMMALAINMDHLSINVRTQKGSRHVTWDPASGNTTIWMDDEEVSAVETSNMPIHGTLRGRAHRRR